MFYSYKAKVGSRRKPRSTFIMPAKEIPLTISKYHFWMKTTRIFQSSCKILQKQPHSVKQKFTVKEIQNCHLQYRFDPQEASKTLRKSEARSVLKSSRPHVFSLRKTNFAPPIII